MVGWGGVREGMHGGSGCAGGAYKIQQPVVQGLVGLLICVGKYVSLSTAKPFYHQHSHLRFKTIKKTVMH